MSRTIGLIVAAFLFILFVSNTDFHGMSFQEVTMMLRIYGIFAGIIGCVITVKTGVSILSNMFVGTAVLAILVSFLTTSL